MRRKSDDIRCAFCPELAHFLTLASELYRKHGADLVITSGSEETARHSFTSLHYAGRAVDTRTWAMADIYTPSDHQKILNQAADTTAVDLNFPRNWLEVLIEGTHAHTEYQPKRRF